MPGRADPTPPPRHLMRLLGFETERTADGVVRGSLPVDANVAAPSGGPRLGAVGMFVDCLGGMQAMASSFPDWPVTADMTIHLLPTGPVGSLEGRVEVLRRGRRTLVVAVELRAGGAPAGLATVSFALVPRPEGTGRVPFEDAAGIRSRLVPGEGEPPPGRWVDEIGATVVDDGALTVALRPEVENTLGSLHGGVQIALAEDAAARRGRARLGPAAETTDLHIAFLRPGRPGPLRVEATGCGDVAPEGDRLTAEVRIVDADGGLCSHATAAVVAP